MSDYTQNVSFGPKDALTTGDPDKLIKGTEIDAELAEISTAIATKEDEANKGVAGGYASLDGSGTVPSAQLPAATDAAKGAVELATSAETVTGTDTARAVTPAGLEAWAAQNAGMVKDLSDLADPGADRILFWDESADAVAALSLGTGVSISGTTLSGTSNASELTSGTIPDARIQASGVTQHQASLSIAETQIADGAILGRLAAAETASGVWNFSNGLQSGGIVVGYRGLPAASVTTGTPVAADAGKSVNATAGVTIPANVFAAGDVLVIDNQSAGSITITQGTSLTLTMAATTSTGNRTLVQNGVATVKFRSATTAVISGSGLA